MTLNSILDKAKNSSLYLFLLNIVLRRIIPYNAPHRFKVEKVNEESLEVSIPFIKKNKNHINGIHACALATLCEYISGLSLARALPPENYRLILQTIHVDYLYQGKTKLFARFGIDEQKLNEIKSALKENDAVVKEYSVSVYDISENHICTGKITWQVKEWGKVSVKV